MQLLWLNDARSACNLRLQNLGFLDVVVEIVQVVDGDPQVRDSHRHIVVVQDALRLLYIGSRQKGAHEELSNLLGAGFEVFVASGTAEDVDFTEYDLVVIDDVPASEVGSTLLSALKVSVRDDGVGLFYSGGEAAFGRWRLYRLRGRGRAPGEALGQARQGGPRASPWR